MDLPRKCKSVCNMCGEKKKKKTVAGKAGTAYFVASTCVRVAVSKTSHPTSRNVRTEGLAAFRLRSRGGGSVYVVFEISSSLAGSLASCGSLEGTSYHRAASRCGADT